MPAHLRLSDDRIVETLRRAGGRARVSELVAELGVHRDTLHRRLRRLIAEGVVESPHRGEYQLRGHSGLGEDAARLASTLDTSGLDAHVTGFDVLAPYAHQFVFAVPHLVYAAPTALDAAEATLTSAGWLVQRAESAGGVSVPDPSKLVILRKQSDPERYRVHGPVAPVEKAWVDALRESTRGSLPIEAMELGRILRALRDHGNDMRYLRHYARQLGYEDRVDAAMHGAETRDRRDLAALRAGFQA